MGYIGQVVSGSVAAASLAGTVYMGVQTVEAYEEFQVTEAARAAATDVEEHGELNSRVSESGITLVATALGTVAIVGICIPSFWGIYETRLNKTRPASQLKRLGYGPDL